MRNNAHVCCAQFPRKRLIRDLKRAERCACAVLVTFALGTPLIHSMLTALENAFA